MYKIEYMYFPSATVQLYTIDCTQVYFVISRWQEKKNKYTANRKLS
jgi:hypothetical protein